jgi:hypothetical protein
MSNAALEKIKNRVAIKNGWLSFDHYYQQGNKLDVLAMMDEVASESVKEYKEKLKKKLSNLSTTTHGRVFTTEVIELIDETMLKLQRQRNQALNPEKYGSPDPVNEESK